MMRLRVLLLSLALPGTLLLAKDPSINPTPPSVAGTHAIPVPKIQQSLVRITTTSQDANYREPWEPGAISGAVGTGFVIDGQRILTNAHVVSNARFLTVEKEDDPRKYTAKVQFVAHDCDLAVLKINEPGFFDTTAPLEFGGIPEIQSTRVRLWLPGGRGSPLGDARALSRASIF